MQFLEKLLECTPNFFKEKIEINMNETFTCTDKNGNLSACIDQVNSDLVSLIVNPFDHIYTEQGNNFEDLTFRIETI